MPTWLAITLFIMYIVMSIFVAIMLIACAKIKAEEEKKRTSRKKGK